MNHDFWMNVLAHFIAIVLGGLKLAIVTGLFWYFVRKKYLAKWMGALMQDLTKQLGQPMPEGAAVTPVAGAEPLGTGIGAGFDGYGTSTKALLDDFNPIPMVELQPFLREMGERDPKTQAEILEIAAKHGLCWDTFGRLIRKPIAPPNDKGGA